MPPHPLLLILSLACGPGADPDTGQAWSYPLDDLLRLNHAQVIGTHNSYHLQPDPLLVQEWAYSFDPLDEQLSNQGVRQFELDVRWSEELGQFQVYHLPVVDEESTCPLFLDCLRLLRSWSDANPAHLPLTVLIEPKDEGQEVPWQDRIEEFEAELDSVWPAERRLDPDQLQGSYDNLRGAVIGEGGWPVLGELRGKAIFALLDGGEARSVYSAGGTSLAGRAMFVDMDDLSHPLTALTTKDDPVGEAELIAEAVAMGVLVRTRTDASGAPEDGDTSRLEAALASGAHWLSTDFPVADPETGFMARIPGGRPAGCNPVTAPAECTPEALEDPTFVH